MLTQLYIFGLLLAVAGAAGYALGRRRTREDQPLANEDRLAWLQRLSTIGQMMSGVVHEIRTPLNTVILAAEHAQQLLDRGGDPRPHLAAISRETDRAVEILSDILDFAKPTPLDLKPRLLKPLLFSALESLKLRFAERGVQVEISAPEDLSVLASERHLQQVLTILLINALDALPFSGRVHIGAEASGDMVRLTVTDNGIGIEPEKLKRLFEPFVSGKSDSGGTGLGLNVARWIMNKHGGDVSLRSEGIGKGTTVTVLVKRA